MSVPPLTTTEPEIWFVPATVHVFVPSLTSESVPYGSATLNNHASPPSPSRVSVFGVAFSVLKFARRSSPPELRRRALPLSAMGREKHQPFALPVYSNIGSAAASVVLPSSNA